MDKEIAKLIRLLKVAGQLQPNGQTAIVYADLERGGAQMFEVIPSCLVPHPSCLVPHPSCLVPHPSCLVPRAIRTCIPLSAPMPPNVVRVILPRALGPACVRRVVP